MTDTLPCELQNALTLLDLSLDAVHTMDCIKDFKNAVFLLNDCLENYPDLGNQIFEIKLIHTMNLLKRITCESSRPEYSTWLESILLICIDLKREMKLIKCSHPSLFEQFAVYLDAYEDEITPELKYNIKKFIECV